MFLKSLVVAAAVGALALVSVNVAGAHGPDKPKPPKKAIEIASHCAAAGMNSGLAATWTATELADYCIEVATLLVEAEYVTP